MLFFLLLLLLLLLLLWFLVKYFRLKTSKDTVFCTIFVLVKEKTPRFGSVKDENRPKTSLFTVFFSERVENTVFCDVFQQGVLNVPQIPRFSSCFHFQFSKQTNQKQWYLQCFDKTTCKKNRCFGTIFRIFSARARQVKNHSFFAAFLPPLIRTQEGVRSPKIAKLRLNFTFYLSQSLPQSCNTKNYRRLSGASKCCKFRCL